MDTDKNLAQDAPSQDSSRSIIRAQQDDNTNLSPLESGSPSSSDMATMVAQTSPVPLTSAAGGINKRYRPAPAKTFQCRGYGECRMVFSRSEHLARHIRKHTGERPFTCHCSKQFSRLDNLRQHAQTVHADKQDQNERMMRELTSLHATMAAQNKTTQPRGKRALGSGGAPGAPGALASSISQDSTGGSIKQEDAALPMHQRPGTSTGYEGDNGMIYQGSAWHVPPSGLDRPTSRPLGASNHSFRDPGQSFRASTSSSSQHQHQHQQQQQQSQSFLGFTGTFSFGVADLARDGRPGSSSSRPPTSGGADAHHRSLPPLAAVVSASIPAAAAPPFAFGAGQPAGHVLPVPASYVLRRPSTATRPDTAPAAYSSRGGFAGGGFGLGPRGAELSVPFGYGRASELGASSGAFDVDSPSSPTGGPAYDSPFSFHPPPALEHGSAGALASAATAAASHAGGNPRKRPFPGADGPDDDARRDGDGAAPEYYDYGSESRPQSRRLTVMELCNDTDAPAGSGPPLLPGGGSSRPSTSSGLVSSASALALVDRFPLTSPKLLAGAAAAAAAPAHPPAPAAAAGTAGGREPQEFGGGRVFPAAYRGVSASHAAAGTLGSPASVLSPYRGSFVASPTLSSASSGSTRSPRSSPATPVFSVSRSAGGPASRGLSGSPDGAALPRRGAGGEGGRDQVRIAVASPHSPSAVGMRV